MTKNGVIQVQKLQTRVMDIKSDKKHLLAKLIMQTCGKYDNGEVKCDGEKLNNILPDL